jgi:hypothetical protein
MFHNTRIDYEVAHNDLEFGVDMECYRLVWMGAGFLGDGDTEIALGGSLLHC